MKVHDAHLHIIDDPELFGRDIIFTWTDFNQYMVHVSKVQLMPALEHNLNSEIINIKFFNDLSNNIFRDRVWAFYWPHAEEVWDSFLQEYPVAGIKYHPSVSQMSVDKAKAVLDLAEDNNLPLLIHCGRNEKSRIDYVIEAYKKRSIVMIAAHLGGVSPPLVSRALEILEHTASDFDNFYLDTSSIDSSRLIARAINIIGTKRLIFGTDIPFHEYNVLRYAIQQVWERDDIKITTEDMRLIMSENVERIHKENIGVKEWK